MPSAVYSSTSYRGVYPLKAVGINRGADTSELSPLRDNILSRNLQAVADQGYPLEGSSPYMGTAYRGVIL
jgi:hypothetical protein